MALRSEDKLRYVAAGVLGGFACGFVLAKSLQPSIKSNDETIKNKASASSCKSVIELIRPNILDLSPYRCARDDYSSGVLLDANENSFGAPLPPGENSLFLERYPSPRLESLKDLIGEYRKIKRDQIFLGVGSDEAIDMLLRIFCVPGADSIMITPPTYGMYKVCAKVNDVAVQEVPLTSTFDLDLHAMISSVDASTKLIFVCSPGNPTAKSIPHKVVDELCQNVNCMVVVDEAYVDFSTDGSACHLLSQHDNLIVLQTMSKAFGLAGIRLGMAFGNKDVIQVFNNVKAPYSINKLSEDVALRVFSDLSFFHKNMEQIKSQRKFVSEALENLHFVGKVHTSDTNFILFEVPTHAHQIYKNMAENGVVIRYRGNCLHCKDCLRVTVGTPKENAIFLEKLQKTYHAICN